MKFVASRLALAVVALSTGIGAAHAQGTAAEGIAKYREMLQDGNPAAAEAASRVLHFGILFRDSISSAILGRRAFFIFFFEKLVLLFFKLNLFIRALTISNYRVNEIKIRGN